tara:strand:- start:520 stop:1047 length:528 start_codon:yes stop_codon:yes gene_type:complete
MNDFDVSTFVSDIIKVALKKDKKREYNKEYWNKNKEKQKEYRKEYWNKNKNKEKQKEYRKEYNKEYREKNRDKLNAKQKEYDKTHKERHKEYCQTPNGKKSQRISRWKQHGIITDDYDALYNHYLKTSFCDACKVELTYDRYTTATTKCVDHDHSITDAPNFRNILCNFCNLKRR